MPMQVSTTTAEAVATATDTTATTPSEILSRFLQDAQQHERGKNIQTQAFTFSSQLKFTKLIQELKHLMKDRYQRKGASVLVRIDNENASSGGGSDGSDGSDDWMNLKKEEDCCFLDCKLTILLSFLMNHYYNNTLNHDRNSSMTATKSTSPSRTIETMMNIYSQTIQFLFSRDIIFRSNNLYFWKRIFFMDDENTKTNTSSNTEHFNDDGDESDDDRDSYIYPLLSAFVEEMTHSLPSSSLSSSSALENMCNLPSKLYNFFYNYHYEENYKMERNGNHGNTNKKRRQMFPSPIDYIDCIESAALGTVQEKILRSVYSALGYIMSYYIVQLESYYLCLHDGDEDGDGDGDNGSEEHCLNWKKVFQHIHRAIMEENFTLPQSEGGDKNVENNGISSQVINPFWSGNWMYTYNKYSLQIGIASFVLDCMSFSSDCYKSHSDDEEECGVRVCTVPCLDLDSTTLKFLDDVEITFVTEFLTKYRYVYIHVY